MTANTMEVLAIDLDAESTEEFLGRLEAALG
jgi:hypothetical protein